MTKKILSTALEEDILNALSTFPVETTYVEKSDTHYFGKNWFYFNESFCVLNLETDKKEYCLRIDPKHKCILIVSEKGSFDDLDTVDDTYISNFYASEEEYFQDSTVKSIAVPYSIMSRSIEFLKHCQERFNARG